jgi:quercetin dioxygenase-like cupin family protein
MKKTEKIENPKVDKQRYYHPIQKDYATFQETSEETGGERTLIEIELAAGGGNAPHYHLTYDEHFEVLKDALEVQLGKAARTLHPGEKAVAYKTVLHRFRNPTEEPARFLVELRPGHGGFEKALKVAYGLAGDGLASANGAPKKPLPPGAGVRVGRGTVARRLHHRRALFRLLAKHARRKGIDRELEARYCR